MNWLSSKDVLSGAMFALVGALGLFFGRDLPTGQASAMGPGYFPMMLCWAIIAVGVILVVRGAWGPDPEAEPAEAVQWRPVLVIIAAVVGFALLADHLGIILSFLLLILVAGLATAESRWKEVVVSSVVLTAFCTAVFVWGLGLPIPLVPQ